MRFLYLLNQSKRTEMRVCSQKKYGGYTISLNAISRVYDYLNTHTELEEVTTEFVGYFASGTVLNKGKWIFICDKKRKEKLDKVLDFASMSYIAEHYFGKSRQWLYQRINGNLINGKPADFTPEELKTLSFALSELGDVMKDTSLCIMR